MIAITPEDQEWYTPAYILDLVYSVIGIPDLDPCCNRYGSPNVVAKDYCRLPFRDGLTEPWHGNVFLNPPYGRGISTWIDKACSEYLTGNTKEMIALVPVKCDTQWWAELTNTALCWCAIRGRVDFSNPAISTIEQTLRKTGTFASAVVLCTTEKATLQKFLEIFNRIGDVWIPHNLNRRIQFPREFYGGANIKQRPIHTKAAHGM